MAKGIKMEKAVKEDDLANKESIEEEDEGIEEDELAVEGEGGDGEEGEDDEDDDDDDDDVALELITQFQADVIEDKGKARNSGLSGRQVALSSPDLKIAEQYLSWLIAPVEIDKFYSEYWERRPFVIKRPKNRGYYDGWFHKRDIEQLLEEKRLEYGRGVDVTRYVDGERQTLNGEGIAEPADVWEKYKEGCSVRVLHPQRWCDPLWLMLSTLERHWNCIAGCNAYLTPPGTQGFSPHYDDIEAFILQTEGTKRWKLYAPSSPEEVLPRFSSPNFMQEEIGDPILEVDLEPGDLLFMPRGTVHQAVAAKDAHSLHITISTGQSNSWAEYLALAVPRAIEVAAEDRVELRKNLPRDAFSFMGVANIEKGNESKRAEFLSKITSLMETVMDNGPWDAAVDQLAVGFLRRRMPLYPTVGTVGSKADPTDTSGKKRRRTEEEGEGEGGEAGKGNITGDSTRFSADVKITTASKVRVVAPGIARLAVEEEAVAIYHSLHNSKSAHNVLEEEGEGEEGVDGEESAVHVDIAGAPDGDNRAVGHGSSKACKASDADMGNKGSCLAEKKRKVEREEKEKEACCCDGPCGDDKDAKVSFEKGRLEFPLHFGDAIDRLLRAYPETVKVGKLDLDSKKECVALVSALVREGLLVAERTA